MALIYCKNCGHTMSDQAYECPQCHTKNKKKGKGLLIGILISIFIILLAVILLVVLLNNKSNEEEEEEHSSYSNSTFYVEYPSGNSFVVKENEYYIYLGEDVIPYILIYNYSAYNDGAKVLTGLKNSMAKDKQVFMATEVDKVELYGKSYDHITMTYKVDDKMVEDNRYAIVYNNTVWVFTTKEVKDRDDTSKVLKVVLETFKVY